MSETIKRTLMGIVMAVVVLAAIIFLPNIWFYGLVAIVLLLTGFEWIRLISHHGMLQLFYGLVLLAGLVALWWVRWLTHFSMSCIIVDVIAMIIGISQLFAYANNPQSKFANNVLLRAILSLIILISAQYFLTMLRMHGNFWIVYCIGLVAMFDTGAYFAGRAFGKTPLALKLSPKKTWGGFMGGCLLGLLFSALMLFLLHSAMQLTLGMWILMFMMTVIMSAISVFGDLFESMQKRLAGVKDSSHILPGHGGFFDRIDALLFVLPIMFFYRECLVFLMNRHILEGTLILLKHTS